MPSPPTLAPILCAAVALGGCGGDGQRAGPAPSGSLAAVPSSSVAPTVDPTSTELAKRLLRRPAFVRAAASHDPVDLAALGHEAGATTLVAALADPTARPTALAALPFSDDSDFAFGPLARAARDASGEDGADLLDALAASLERPTQLGELLDDQGVKASVADLLSIARDEKRGPRVRALSVTLLGRLAERGFVDRASIPSL